MASRLELHEELCEILGSRNVYFQPPESVKMEYPCIRYSMLPPDVKRADDVIYGRINQYKVIVIGRGMHGDIIDKMMMRFSMCKWDASYPKDNLNHTVLSIYY